MANDLRGRLQKLEQRQANQGIDLEERWSANVYQQLSDEELECIFFGAAEADDDLQLLGNPVWCATHLTPAQCAAFERWATLADAAGLLNPQQVSLFGINKPAMRGLWR